MRSGTASHWLIALALLIAATSVAPGTPVGSWSALVAALEAGATLAVQEPAFLTVLERCATFLPLGALLQRELARRRGRWPGAAACGLLALFAVALEVAQAAVVGRHPRVSDLVLALGFGASGVGLASWLGAQPTPAKVKRALLGALVLGNVALTAILVQAHRGADLAGWDCSFPLLLANERSGDRPWRGRLQGLAIYPSALVAADAARLRSVPFDDAGAAVRAQAGALAVLDFSRVAQARVPQRLPDGLDLDLRLPADGASWRVADGALEVQGPRLIAGGPASRELCRSITESGAFALEVAFASGAGDQRGPARIVAQSTSVWKGNFMLGEEQGGLVFRVRTPANGAYGGRMPLRTPPAILGDGWRHVVAVHGGGTAELFLDGAPAAPAIRYYERLWLDEGRVMPFAALAAVGLVVMGMIAALLIPERPILARLGGAYLGAALVPSLAALSLGLWLGHDPDGWFLGATVAGPPAGVAIALMLARLRARRRPAPA